MQEKLGRLNDSINFSVKGGTDRTGKLCYNLSISKDLTQMVNFPTRIPDLGLSQSCCFGFVYFF